MKKKLGISLLFIMLLLCGCGGGVAPGTGAGDVKSPKAETPQIESAVAEEAEEMSAEEKVADDTDDLWGLDEIDDYQSHEYGEWDDMDIELSYEVTRQQGMRSHIIVMLRNMTGDKINNWEINLPANYDLENCSAPGNILPKESVEIGFYGVSRKKPKVIQFRLYTLTSDYDYLLGDELGYKNFFLE